MKIRKIASLLVLVSPMLLAGCKGTLNDYTAQEDFLSISGDIDNGGTISFEPSKSSKTLCINSDDIWEIVGEREWLSVDKRKGSGKNDIVTMCAEPYLYFDTVDLKVFVNNHELGRLHVSNSINGTLIIDSTDTLFFAEKVSAKSFSKDHLMNAIRVKSNVKWELTHRPSWITKTLPDNGGGDNDWHDFIVECKPHIISDKMITKSNMQENVRLDSLVFQLKDYPIKPEFFRVIYIKQVPTYYFYFDPSATPNFNLPIEDEVEFKICSNVKWQISPEKAELLNIYKNGNEVDKDEQELGDASFRVNINNEKTSSSYKPVRLNFSCVEENIDLKDFDIFITPQ